MRCAFPTLVCVLALTGTAFADTAYVKPSSFMPKQDQTITVEVSFSDECCEPRYAVRTDTYTVINPDGSKVEPDRIETFATTTMLEHTLAQQGTTRISTGERLGRKGEYVLLDGQFHLVNSPDAEPIHIPEGTPILSSQTATVTDAYVSVGAPNWKAIRAPIGRLVITPASHPNMVKTGIPFTAKVAIDGEPVSGATIVLTNERQRLGGESGVNYETNDDGIFSIVFEQPGLALLMVRLQAPSPEGSETDIRSYTTALIIDVGID